MREEEEYLDWLAEEPDLQEELELEDLIYDRYRDRQMEDM